MTNLALAPDPDANRYAELGIADPVLGRLIHVALSRVVGETGGERRPTRNIDAVIAGLGLLEFRRADGTLEPPVAPHLPRFGWPDGRSALHRLEMTPAQLDAAWSSQSDDGVHAVLPLEVVCEFIPGILWPMVAQIIEWGPAETSERLERFARREAQREVRPTHARPAGSTLTASTLTTVLTAFRRMMTVFVQMRLRGYPAEALDTWIALPRPIDAVSVGAVDDRTDRSAPPLLLVRQALRGLDGEVRRRSLTKKGRETIRRMMRKRLLLALLATTGARVGAIARARVCDYDPRHRFPTGDTGPALRIFPGKTMAASTARWKALPEEVAAWLEETIQFFELSGTQTLWLSDQKKEAPMTANGVADMIAGDPSSGVAPLLPRADQPRRGYTAHTLRHLAEQLAYEVGHDYLQEYPDARAFITPQVIADALLDHAIGSDHLGYKDISTEEGRERWARVGAAGLWEYVWGDRGARKVPDVERMIRARDCLLELQAETTATHARIAALREQRRGLEQRGLDENAPPTTDELVRLLFRLSTIAGAVDEEHEELERLQRAQFAAETESELARTTLVPLADDAPMPELDEQLSPATPSDGANDEREPVRDWLTVAEAAHSFGVSEPTMRRWFRGELPHAEGDPRNPWQPTEVEAVIERRSTRKQRLVVSRLDRSRIAPEVMRTIKTFLTQLPT
jgi:integrase